MSEEQQLDSSDFGRPGIEKNAGYSPMVPANPVDTGEPELTDDSPAVRHLDRQEVSQPVERDYLDVQTGKRRDDNETVSPEQGAHDLANVRNQEREARERQSQADLNEALDYLKNQVEAPAEQHQQHQPDPNLELQPEQMDLDTARAQADAAWVHADSEISRFLENPVVRERVEQSFNQVRQQAAAEVEHAKATYQQGLAQNAAAALAVLTTQFPEFAGLSGAQLEGALRVSNSQRAEAFRNLAGQVGNVVSSFQQHQQQTQANQQAAYNVRLEQFKAAEDKKFDAATAHENPETLKTFRSNVFPMLETHYGIPQARMRALASGQQAINSVELLHSSEFQRILLDALKWQSAQTAVRNAAVRPVPQVQRPGISEPSKIDDGEVSAARARFNREGGNVGRDGLRNAAALVAARRARS